MYNYHQPDANVKIEFLPVTEVNELPNGERLFLEIDNQPIVLLNLGGEFYAIGDVCSHDEGSIGDGEVDGDGIICPRHGARFDLHTGKALQLPAVVDIPAYPIRVKDGKIEIGIPSR